MTEQPLTLESLLARLNGQKDAIIKLRADRDALTARVAALEGGKPVLSVSTASPARGTFTPKDTCMMCGRSKGPNRWSTLTCQPCGAKRKQIIDTKGADRTPITTTSCGNCGAPNKPWTRMLCGACSTSFREWKASH